jgi:hypothetical protein
MRSGSGIATSSGERYERNLSAGKINWHGEAKHDLVGPRDISNYDADGHRTGRS